MLDVENLSKRYRRPRADGGGMEDFWALRDVSFSVDEGEVVGIIGKNGAGKSTLLKILSRITAPTGGQARLKGRVGSLLEVGTGFHPEMTGRENVYMNGIMLGMSREEVRRNYDAIVEFSGVGDFIETPVKRYSSGMYTRLAFAVAAHLEPEILIVDEVLAVGDADFQKKCLGKMNDVAKQGRTVLFVSHNMQAMRNLCTRCIHLEKGVMIADSPDVETVVAGYLRRHEAKRTALWENNDSLLADEKVTPLRMAVLDPQGELLARPVSGDEAAWITISFALREAMSNLSIGYALYDHTGAMLYWSYPTDAADFLMGELAAGTHTLRSRLPLEMLNDGEYQLQLIAGLQGQRPLLTREASEAMVRFDLQGHKLRSSYWVERRPTPMAPLLRWEAA